MKEEPDSITTRKARSDESSVRRHHRLPDPTEARTPRYERWSVNVHRDLASIGTLKGAWEKFAEEVASPFQTFTWNFAWYRHFCSEESILLLELVRNGETAAILPGYLQGREIRLAGDETCDYQDILIADDVTAQFAITKFLEWANGQKMGYSFYFHKLASMGKLHRALVEADVPPSGGLVFFKFFAPCPYVSIEGGLDDYLAQLSRKTRQDCRRTLKRFDSEAPDAKVDISRGHRICVDHLKEGAEFHIQNFRKDGTSPFCDERLLKMLGEVCSDDDLGVQFATLKNQGDLLAIDFGFARRGRYFGYLTAFDPAYRKLAPGKCLLLQRVDTWAGEDQIEVLDFLSGDESYKRGYTKGDSYSVYSVRLMSESIFRRLHCVWLECDKLSRFWAKAVLQKAGFRKG